MPRFYCPTPLTPGQVMDLPATAARHVQVLRLQPGDGITLFDGLPDTESQFGEYTATVTQMGRSQVQVNVGAFTVTQREPTRRVHLALGMPANERMDWLVEKAAELGMASLQPLMTERSVLKLAGERADKKQAHWQSVALAGCEQCGGNRVPLIHPVMTLTHWLKDLAAPDRTPQQKLLLSLRAGSLPMREAAMRNAALPDAGLVFLSGPEGGLSPAEEEAAVAAGFQPTSLGQRVLRAETAALVALAALLV